MQLLKAKLHAGTLLDETMGVSNGSALLEEEQQQETVTDKSN